MVRSPERTWRLSHFVRRQGITARRTFMPIFGAVNGRKGASSPIRRVVSHRLQSADSGHRPDGVPRHTRPVADPRHIGGLMPSFSTYMKFAVTLPSSPFGPARNTA